MDNRWYCRVRNQQMGPLSWQQLVDLVRRGSVTAHSLVRSADETTWIEAGQIPELLAVMRATAPPPPPSATPPEHAPPVPPLPVPPLPVGLPVGTPVGTPVGVPVGTPVGTPVHAVAGAEAAAGNPAPAPLITPVSRSASSLKRPAAAGEKSRGTAKTSTRESDTVADESPAAHRKRRQQAARKKLLLIGGGLIVVTGLVAAIAFVATRPPAATTAPTTIAQDSTNTATSMDTATSTNTATSANTAKSADGVKSADGATAGAGLTAEAADRGRSSEGAKASPAAAPDAARQAAIESLLKSIAPWRDASRATGVSTKSMRLQVTGMWFAGVAGAEVGGNAGRPRAVCAEVRISCLPTAESAFVYNSWNSTGSDGKSPSILLVESSGTVHSLIPTSQWSDPARQTAPVKLQPGQSVDDLLVFTAPADESIEHVRLALKMSNLGQGERYLGLQFPRELIAASKPLDGGSLRPAGAGAGRGATGGAAVAGAAAAAAGGVAAEMDAPKGDATKSDVAKGDAPKGDTAKGEVAPTAKPAKPALSPDEDINVLKKQIEDSLKENQAARQKDIQEMQKKEQEKREREEREAAEASGKPASKPGSGKSPAAGAGPTKKTF